MYSVVKIFSRTNLIITNPVKNSIHFSIFNYFLAISMLYYALLSKFQSENTQKTHFWYMKVPQNTYYVVLSIQT